MRILTSALLALTVTACGSDKLNGTWNGTGTLTIPGSTTQVPYTSVATFTSSTQKASVKLTLPLPSDGSGTITINGTYTESGSNLKLSNITVDASTAAGTITPTPPTNYTCVSLNLLNGAPLCFDTPQTSPYSVNGTTLTISVTFGFLGTDGKVSESTTPATVTFTKA